MSTKYFCCCCWFFNGGISYPVYPFFPSLISLLDCLNFHYSTDVGLKHTHSHVWYGKVCIFLVAVVCSSFAWIKYFMFYKLFSIMFCLIVLSFLFFYLLLFILCPLIQRTQVLFYFKNASFFLPWKRSHTVSIRYESFF